MIPHIFNGWTAKPTGPACMRSCAEAAHTVAAAFNFGDTPRPVTAHMPSPAVPRCFCTRVAAATLCRRNACGALMPLEGHVLTFPVPAFSGLVLELDAPDGSRMTGKPNQ